MNLLYVYSESDVDVTGVTEVNFNDSCYLISTFVNHSLHICNTVVFPTSHNNIFMKVSHVHSVMLSIKILL